MTRISEGQIIYDPEGNPVQLRGGKLVPVKPEEIPETPSQGQAAIGGAASGMTLGLADELSGLVGAVPASIMADVTLREAYQGIRDAARQNLDEQRSAHPYTFAAGEFVGGAAVPGGAVAKGATMAPNLMRRTGGLVAGGGAAGGVAGFGYSDDAGYDLAADSAKGALLGATLSPIVGYAGAKGAEMAAGLAGGLSRRMVPSEVPALLNVRRALEDDGIVSADGARAALGAMGPEAVLADVGPNSTAMAAFTTRNPGPGRSMATEALDARQAGQQSRLDAAARETLNPKWDNYWSFKDDLIAARSAGADDLYARAYQNTIMPSELLVDFSRRELGQEVLREAQARIGNSFNARDTRGMGQPEAGMSTRLWQEAVRVLRDKAGAAFRNGQGGLGDDYSKWMRAIRSDIHSQNPDLQKANSFFAGSKELEEAADMGREMMRGQRTFAGDAERAMKELTEGEMEAFRVGLFRGIQDRIESASTRGDASRRLDQSERLVGVMREAFNDEDAFNKFWQTVDAEMRMAYTRDRAKGNSITSDMMFEGQGVSAALADDVTRGATVLDVAARAIRRLVAPRLEPEDYDRMAQMMFGRMSDDRLEAIFGARAADQLPSSTQGRIGTGAGVLAAPNLQEFRQ